MLLTNKCKYVSPKIGMEFSICEGNDYLVIWLFCYLVLSFILRPVLKLLEQYGCPKICALKFFFLYIHSAQTKITIPNEV